MKASVPNNTSPSINARQIVHIINPASGGSKNYEAICRAVDKQGGEKLISEYPGHIKTLVADLFKKNPYAHAIIYGGDGTVFDAVGGIMESGHSETASFSVIPSGSGNDFSSYVNDSGVFEKQTLNKIDVIKSECDGNVRYYANVMNMGFDCDVVRESYTLKKFPLFRGPMAYVAGIVKVLLKKKTIDADITLSGCVSIETGEATPDIHINKKVLLSAFANSKLYGGGFHAAPLASISDGLMDVIIINDMSRLQFLTLVNYYKQGTFIDENGNLLEKFKPLVSYYRCRKMSITGPEAYCLDGEVLDTGKDRTIVAEVCPNAVWYSAL